VGGTEIITHPLRVNPYTVKQQPVTGNQESIFDFSRIRVKEYFFPVVAAASDTTVVVSSKLLLLFVLNTKAEGILPAFTWLISLTGLKEFFFIS